jgi:hypothetical protein
VSMDVDMEPQVECFVMEEQVILPTREES